MGSFKKRLVEESRIKFGEPDIGRYLRYLLDVEGYTQRSIAEKYGVSEDTVFYHVRERRAHARTKDVMTLQLIKRLGYVDAVDYFIKGELAGRSLQRMATELGITKKEASTWRKKVIAKSKEEEPHRWQQQPG